MGAAPASTFAALMMLMFGPVMGVTLTAQSLGQARVALRRIEQLSVSLECEGPLQLNATSTPVKTQPNYSGGALVLRGVSYTYRSENKERFCVGPIDLTVHPGQVVFVAGGNGSGKTTLGKLIAGLYVPDTGEILSGGTRVSDSNRGWYRSHFSAVFSDFCLFESTAALGIKRSASEAPQLLETLRLNNVVDQTRDLLSQARTFSTGERKRLALFLTYLEDRPIYLFDEFAADQDPECKDLFYHELLPKLKAQGKIVIAITHDTRYFSQADLVVFLERGMPPTLRALSDPQALGNIRVTEAT